MAEEKVLQSTTPPDLGRDAEEAFFATRVESFWSLVWKRFRRHKLAMASSLVIIIMILVAVFAPVISPFPFDETHMDALVDGMPAAPNGTYWFGTDNFGRDYLTRCIYGGRISLSVGLVSTLIALLIGVPLGCIAGFYGGKVDMVIMRVTEFLSCIPTFFLILTVNAMVEKPSIYYVMVIIGVFGWMGITRQVRAQFLSLRQQEFVQAAFALGYRDRKVIFRHILPNALVPVIVSASMSVASAIMTESSLSYLGMGVQEPVPSWGAMLKVGQGYLRAAPHMAVIPGILILIVSLALNFIGDGLRDALDPRVTKG